MEKTSTPSAKTDLAPHMVLLLSGSIAQFKHITNGQHSGFLL
jgi:hypothetical protein